jgi:hypothetical protein
MESDKKYVDVEVELWDWQLTEIKRRCIDLDELFDEFLTDYLTTH